MEFTTGACLLKVKAFTFTTILGIFLLSPLKLTNASTYCTILPENAHVPQNMNVWECNNGYKKIDDKCIPGVNIQGEVEGSYSINPLIPTAAAVLLFGVGMSLSCCYITIKKKNEGSWAKI